MRPRQRARVTSQRGRQPGAAPGIEAMCQLVIAALGAAWASPRRSTRPVTPEARAANCSRRLATKSKAPRGSTSTASRSRQRSAVSIAQSVSAGRRGTITTRRSGVEAEGGEAGAVEIVVRRDPGDGPAARGETAEQEGGEAGRGAVLGRTRDLVQAAERQAAPGQRGIDVCDAEPEHAAGLPPRVIAPRIGADEIAAQARQDLLALGRAGFGGGR